jgi:serine/threonine protein kinase/WD40 repeat protein
MSATDASPSADRDPIERMAESFLERYRRGERPSIEDYAAQHPELADEIRELLPALVQLEQGMSAAEETGSFHGRVGTRSATVAGTPRSLGDYTILREIGRGGMGVVYEAVQRSLGRHVALKVLPWHQIGEPPQLRRFEMEARSAARLHHTNIVPVFGVGEDQGVHYYAMQFIHGQGLDAIIAELRRFREDKGQSAPAAEAQAPAESTATLAADVARGMLTGRFAADVTPDSAPTETHDAPSSRPISADIGAKPFSSSDRSELTNPSQRRYFRQVARVGLQVAEALSYAHAQGILHRDIKPSNLLMDTRGTVWVADFGLAKAEGSDGPTRTGDIVGTLRYMAPERFEGKADRRSDVYALGATLYELLTLRPVFGEVARPGLVECILHDPPVPPRKLDHHVPRDLETIVLKALAKDPERRYPDAGAMADDLRRVLDDQPVRARRIGPAERAWRWCRRNPAVAGLMGLATGLLVLVAVVASVGYARTSAALASKQVALGNERAARREAVGHLYHALVGEARALGTAREVGYRAEVFDRLGRANRLDTPERDPAELRREAVACLGDFVGLTPLTLEGFEAYALRIAAHPRSEWVAVSLIDGTVHVYDRLTGEERARIPPPEGPRDGPSTVGPAGQRPRQTNVVEALDFEPEGRLLVGFTRGTVRVVEDLASGTPRVTDSPADEGQVRGFFPMPDVRTLVVSAAPKSFWVRDLAGDGADVLRFDLDQGFRDAVWGLFANEHAPVAISPDGRRVAASIAGWVPGEPEGANRVVLWDLATRSVLKIAPTPFRNSVYEIAFSPDGTWLAIGSDGGFALLDAADLRVRQAIRLNSAMAVRFHPEGRALAVGTLSGLVQIWGLDTGRMMAELKHSGPGGVRRLAFGRDGRTLVSMGAPTVRVWDLAGATERTELAGHEGGVTGVAFATDGEALASTGKDRTVKIWAVSAGRLLRTLGDLPDLMQNCAFSHDGTTLFAGSYNRGALRAWDTTRWESVESAEGAPDRAKGPVYGLDIAHGPRGEFLAVSGMGLQVWRLDRSDDGRLAWAPVADHASPRSVHVALNRDASLVAHVERDRGIKVRDLVKDRELPDSGPGLLFGWQGLAFRSNSELVFVGGDGRAVVWDVLADRLVRTIGKPGRFGANHCAVSLDGRWLAAQETPSAVAIVDLERGEVDFTFREERSPIWSLAWAPDGRRLAIGLSDGGAVVWDLGRVREQLQAVGLGEE